MRNDHVRSLRVPFFQIFTLSGGVIANMCDCTTLFVPIPQKIITFAV